MSEKPNIILINCDDLGYGDLACYGSKVNKTPALDKLAAEGIKFTDFYMTSPVCSPSRGSMLTGCYPPRIGFGSFVNGGWVLFPGDALGLHEDEITIAKLLKQADYQTKIVGKWHCGDQKEFLPIRHGFDSYYGIPYSNDMGRQNADDKQPPLPLLKDEEVIQEQPDQRGITERYTEECVSFIRDNKDKPFFLYLAHMYVHLPIYVPKQFLDKAENGPYGAAVEHIDWVTAVLMDELKRQGIDDNTLIVFTSDNGSRAQGEGGSNAPLRGRKTQTWEGGQRLPCIMRWPRKIKSGLVNKEITSSMDFYKTFAALAGVEIPTDRIIDGKDIRPMLFNEPDAKSQYDAFFYYKCNDLEAVRSGKWKLHVSRDKVKVEELYNLESDIGEQTNLFNQEPEIVKDLMIKIKACQKDIGDEAAGIKGENIRPIGKVDSPDTLTHYDPEHPYIIALYDLKERG
ncbi:MAG: sulfatase [Pseudomonadales bacterium]|nr:sulfatase [Pseudomonadales bacterium]PCJ62264.1 MAG: Cerebroside-sulfatase [Planctomycetota bacterium]